MAAVQSLHAQELFARRGLPFREVLFDLPVGHKANQLRCGDLGNRMRGDVSAVAQDGNAVADLEKLLHAVGDIDEGDAFLLQVSDGPEQPLDFAASQS